MPAAFIPVSGFPLSHELFRVAGGGPGWQVAGNIFRSQVSAIWYRYGLSGSGTGAGPEPDPAPEYLNPGPDGRDPGPENGLAIATSWRDGVATEG